MNDEIEILGAMDEGMKSNTSKPVFIIRFPYDLKRKSIYDEYLRQISRQLKDYHILGLHETGNKSIKFECHGHELTEFEFEDLKQYVSKVLKFSNDDI